MAKVERKKFTMQVGFAAQITPVSAASQGVKSSPQGSLSGDRSFKTVGNLVTLEFKASRKKPSDIKSLSIILNLCDERPQLLSD